MSETKPSFGWGHINVNVSNLERSVEFYEKLGFEVFLPGIPYLDLTPEPDTSTLPETAARALGLPAGTRGRACIMQLDNGFPKLDLTELADLDQSRPLADGDLGIVRLCLVSRDLAGDYLRLREFGVEFLSQPQPAKDGMADVAVCIDPDGTLIELLQVYLEKWPALPPDTQTP